MAEKVAPLLFPATLQEAISYFGNTDQAFSGAVALRWPDGVTCPRCESKENSFDSARRIWYCRGCHTRFALKIGTIFEDSSMPIGKWMLVAWLICNSTDGVTSREIAGYVGTTQKTAWFMEHRIRQAIYSGAL